MKEIIPTKFGNATRLGLELSSELTFEQWEQIGEKIQFAEGAVNWWLGDWANHGEGKFKEKAAQAYSADIDYQTLANAKWVCGRILFSLRREKLKWSHHKLAAGTDDPEYWLDRAERENLSVEELRDAIRSAKRLERIRLIAAPWPVGSKFSIVYADPPWRYEHPAIGASNRSIENHYPTMDLEEICALPVSSICTDDALLYLWATAPKLAECFKVIEAWGFEYRTNGAWDKEVIGMGYHFRNQHELLLVAKRGAIPPPEAGTQPSSVYRERRGEHSAKPYFYYEMIEAAYPGLQKIELFCRGDARNGWAIWGNQAVAA